MSPKWIVAPALATSVALGVAGGSAGRTGTGAAVLAAGTPIAADAAEASGPQDAADGCTSVRVEVPLFEVDPTWPEPLPNHWILGSTIGVGVDSRDHVFVLHRPGSVDERTEAGADLDPPMGECCVSAPPVLEFDPEGNLVDHWGGPGEGYDWFTSNHGLQIDPDGHVWMGGNGRDDAHVLKFTRDGEFLMQVGAPADGADSRSTERFAGPAKVSFAPDGEEAFVADGYRNRRVAVIDPETGEFLRYWGAYGKEPEDVELGPYDPDTPPAEHFRTPVHCAQPSVDGLVYVCDRVNDRIQVFRTDGTFVEEKRIAPRTRADGSVWDIALSPDPEQRFLYVADGRNMRIHVLDRTSLEVLTSFGDGGRQPGQFYGVHSIETDSEGNLYTTETYEGKRVQKFVFKGLGTVEKGTHQGVVWPGREEGIEGHRH